MPNHDEASGQADAGEKRLQQALSLHQRFLSGSEGADVSVFLQAHADLADLLEPLLRDDGAADAQAEVGGDGRLGDYRLVRQIGRGGMGVVFEAEQVSLGRRVALKILPAQFVSDPRAFLRFKREAQLAAGLDHPGVTKVHAVHEVAGTHFFVMDLVSGAALGAVVAELGRKGGDYDPRALRRSVQELRYRPGDAPATESATEGRAADEAWSGTYEQVVVRLTAQVADALAHAHRAGVVHRDVKPANILVRADGTAVLTDFGIARLEGAVGCTLTGDFAGTPSYASPEQVRGQTDIDGRSDVFSLGATLYELLTLRKAFEADTIGETCTLIVRHEPRSPRRFNAGVSRDLEAVVQRALEKDASARYPGAAAMAEDLRRYLAGRPVQARPVSLPTRLSRWARRNPLASSFLATVTGGAVVVALLGLQAQANGKIAAERLTQFRTVKVAREVTLLRRAVDDAPPPLPENQLDLERRVDLARDLVGRLTGLRAVLAQLQATGDQGESHDPGRSLTDHPARAFCDRLRAGIATLQAKVDEDLAHDEATPSWAAKVAARCAVMTGEADRLQAWIDGRRHFAFADPETEFLHDTLEDQIAELEWIQAQRLPELESRWQWAGSVHATTVTAHADGWRAAIDLAARDAPYDRLRLVPQPGLVPLGADPESGLLEFALARSGAVPTRDAQGTLVFDADSAIVFVLLPGGKARIGTAETEDDPRFDEMASVDEYPALEVELSPFLIAKHEMTHAQWNRLAAGLEAFHDAFKFEARAGFETKPIVRVDWYVCDRVCHAQGLGLPTEAQWEYACRAGTDSRWAWGPEPASLAGRENVADRDMDDGTFDIQDLAPYADGFIGRMPAYSLEGNHFGLHHMHGNVKEWCADWFVERGTLRAGDGLREGARDGDVRAIRGGGYLSGLPLTRSAKRDSAPATSRFETVGLRPILTLRNEDAHGATPNDPAVVNAPPGSWGRGAGHDAAPAESIHPEQKSR